MSPPCQFYNNGSHQYQPNYIIASLNHLILKSSSCFWYYNLMNVSGEGGLLQPVLNWFKVRKSRTPKPNSILEK